MAVDLADMLGLVIDSANDVLKGTAGGRRIDNEQLEFWEKQLRHLVAELEGMLSDLQSGLDIKYLGFGDDGEFVEVVEDYETRIQSLKGRIRSLLDVGR